MKKKKPCEFTELDNYNASSAMLFIRKKILEKKLNIGEIKCVKKYNLMENSYIYLYYVNDEIIYLEEKELDEILEIFNNLENDDLFFSDNIHLEKYNSFLNRKKELKKRKIEGLNIVKKREDLNLLKELKNHYYSPNPRRISYFIPIYPVNLNFFKHDNIYEKEILENIDNLKLPHYKLYTENKYALLKVLKSQFLNHSNDSLNHYLLHDLLPFVNHNHLKNNLSKYYSEKKENYNLVKKGSLNESSLYLLGGDEVIILKDKSNYNIYTKEDFEKKEENMRKRYIFKFDQMVENNHEIDLENLNNYEIINYEIVDGKAFKKEEEEDKYHHGFHSNGIYKAVEGYEKEKFEKIDKNLVQVEIEESYKNFYNIYINHKISIPGNIDTILDLNYFYVPRDRDFMIKIYIEKLWEKGEFLSDFGKAVYKNENLILPETLKIPEWLISNSESDFDNLMMRKF